MEPTETPIDDADDDGASDPPQQTAPLCECVRSSFADHAAHLRTARRRRRTELAINTVVPAPVGNEGDATGPATASAVTNSANAGERIDSDKFDGDCVLRTLNSLLAMVDDRGYARSPQQVQFHDAFIRASSRVMYRSDWSKSKPAIMESNNWADCPSQILVSTPRRFGKTFSIAIFVAALALSCGLEVVVFSPARRASRKLLERIVEFIRLLDCGDRIMEFNQEQCRLKSFQDGKTSLIRSFPSKVSVRSDARTHARMKKGSGGIRTHSHKASRPLRRHRLIFGR